MATLLYLVRHAEQADAAVESETAELSQLGRQQAEALGERLRGTPLTAIHHSPIRRAAATAEILADYLPGTPLQASDLVGDYVPAVPPAEYADRFAGVTEAELIEGPHLATKATAQFFRPGEGAELIVTHTFLIAWFVRAVLGAPDSRWIGLQHDNCGLTVLGFPGDRPARLVSFNDVGHLPPGLRSSAPRA